MNAVMVPEVRIAVPMLEDFGFIARNMRPDEIEQFLAMTGQPEYIADVAARTFANTPGETIALVGRDGLPFAVAGFLPLRPGVMQAWAAATMAGWDQHWRTMTKETIRRMNYLFSVGTHRIETTALASRLKAHHWYTHGLGMTQEGVQAAYCANGEDAITFSRVKEATHGRLK